MHGPDDELKVLGGHARVVSVAAAPGPSYATGDITPVTATGSTYSQSQSHSPPLMHSSSPVGTSPMTEVHPSLMEDLAGVRQQDRDRDREARMERERLFGESPAERAGQSVSASAPGLASAGVEMSESPARVETSASPRGVTMSMSSAGVGMSANQQTPARSEMFTAGANVRQLQSQPYVLAGPVPVPVEVFEDMEGEMSHPQSQVEYFHTSDPTAAAASSFVGRQEQQEHHAGVDATASDNAGVAVVDNFGNVFSIAPSTAQEWGMMMTSDDYTDVCWQGFVAGLGVSGED